MNKNDYMRLSKERLAELLEERDNAAKQGRVVYIPQENLIPCYAPNGICTNPQMDCINCPKRDGGGGYTTTSTGTLCK